MSITYCHNCNNIDEDIDVEHFENCLEESKEETHSLKPLRQDREILGLLERNIDDQDIIEEIVNLIEVEKRQLLETAFKKIRISLQQNIRNEFYKDYSDDTKDISFNVRNHLRQIARGVRRVNSTMNNMLSGRYQKKPVLKGLNK